MIAKKLAIQEETTKLKDGCCIVVIQDGETKRMSYKTFLDVMQNTIEESKKEIRTVECVEGRLLRELQDIRPNVYKEIQLITAKGTTVSLEFYKENTKPVSYNGIQVYYTYYPDRAVLEVDAKAPITVQILLTKY